MFWVKKDSQKQMPKIDFPKKGENTYFKTHNRLKNGYFFNRRPFWEALNIIYYSFVLSIQGLRSLRTSVTIYNTMLG